MDLNAFHVSQVFVTEIGILIAIVIAQELERMTQNQTISQLISRLQSQLEMMLAQIQNWYQAIFMTVLLQNQIYNIDCFVYKMVNIKQDAKITGKEFIYPQMSNLLLHVKDKIFSLFADFVTIEEKERANNGRMMILTMILVKQNQKFHKQVYAKLA